MKSVISKKANTGRIGIAIVEKEGVDRNGVDLTVDGKESYC